MINRKEKDEFEINEGMSVNNFTVIVSEIDENK